MKLSFTTLGCPNWNLETILQNAVSYGFDGIDFRGLEGTLDVTLLPEFSTAVAATRQKIHNAGLEISGISTSITVCAEEKRAQNLDEARRTIQTAIGLGCKNVRVFGGGDLTTHTRAELAAVGLACMRDILALDGADQIHWLFETHDLWVKSVDCRLLLDVIQTPNFGALWDMGHTPRVGEESPEETWEAIGPRVGYTHVKDAVYDPQHALAMSDGWRYVYPGRGQLPIDRALRILNEANYTGWVVFEHEKRWHPNLPEPELAFPAFIDWAQTVL